MQMLADELTPRDRLIVAAIVEYQRLNDRKQQSNPPSPEPPKPAAAALMVLERIA